jgi:hypothetical protein
MTHDITSHLLLLLLLSLFREMQEHIRNWGSVVTRLDVHSDFKPFFATKPAGVYPGHGKQHAT